MINNLFETEEDIRAAVANFKALKKTAGWQLLEQIVNANVEVLQEQILEGFENETKEEIDRKRDKLKAYKEVITTPDFWIGKLSSDKADEKVEDPYYTVESLSKERSKKS